MSLEIPYSTGETVRATLETVTDPTGSAVEFQLTDGYTPPSGSGWVAGTWSGSYDTTAQRAIGVSPNIGSGQALAIEQGKQYTLWVKFHTSVIREVLTFRAT